MRPEAIFDACLDRVRELQLISACGRISAIRADACAKDGPPRVGNLTAEYIADFQLCGERVLRRRWPPRWLVFRACFMGGIPFEEHAKAERIPAATVRWWAMEIKKGVGRELPRCGLFPPRLYRERIVSNATDN